MKLSSLEEINDIIWGHIGTPERDRMELQLKEDLSRSQIASLKDRCGKYPSKEEYEFALNRIEELLPLVTDRTSPEDKKAKELILMSDVVEAYEKSHYPINKNKADRN